MKAIVINASPMMDKGNTALVLTPFIDGMKESGADVEIYYTKKLNIKPCQGEYYCQIKSPGKCFQQDDMNSLLPKLDNADIQIFATPLYTDGVSGPLKNLWDRMIPSIDLSVEMRDGHCRHPRRDGNNTGKVVLISNCGFWEYDNFAPMLAHTKAICRNLHREFAGALLRPHGSVLKSMSSSGTDADDIFDAAKDAGRQLINEGKILDHLQETVSRPLISLESYLQRVNQAYRQKPSLMEI